MIRKFCKVDWWLYARRTFESLAGDLGSPLPGTLARCFGHGIGTVGASLSPSRSTYDDLPSRQFDDSPLLKIVQGDGDASAPHPERL